MSSMNQVTKADLEAFRLENQEGIKKEFDNLKSTIKAGKSKAPKIHPDDSRHDIAKWFINKYFIFTGLILLTSLVYNSIISHVTDPCTFMQINVSYIVSFLIGQITTTLGIVVGFYFKNK